MVSDSDCRKLYIIGGLKNNWIIQFGWYLMTFKLRSYSNEVLASFRLLLSVDMGCVLIWVCYISPL